ncbi:putative short chain oxidoreductase/dehydrogenase [Aspergillus lucknowensis]|uniref:Short chain oxidoreductase/dehydrogenase n=1 Tax=Aspergillus lucknowensis TaxID=176173 RepID=A0ABR4M1A1_9EURO
MSQVWFITGASSGFGLDLALLALSAGHKVIGTVRDASRASDAVSAIKAKGGEILELDVTKADTIAAVVEKANGIYGGVDILVNNAGYSLLGAVEDMKEEEVKLQMETNFFGPLRLIRAFLPTLRTRGNGNSTIVNISSIAGQDAQPTCGLYAASKFALEGLSEALALEVAPFNIAVLIVEPGAFRTNFLHASKQPETPLSEPYKGGPVDTVLQKFGSAAGKQRGDPAKAVARIFEVVTGTGEAGGLRGKILRLPLGPDCLERIERKLKKFNADIEATRSFALATDFD